MTKRFRVRASAKNSDRVSVNDLRQSETDTQQAYMRWLEVSHPKAFEVTHHSPNGEYRDKITGAKLKRMGTKAGFPDVVMYQPAKSYVGLVMEIKEQQGRVSGDQEFWLNHFERQKYFVATPIGLDQCILVSKKYLALIDWPE